MKQRLICLLGGVVFLSGCAAQPFPGPNDFDVILTSYETDFRQILIAPMKSEALELASDNPGQHHEGPAQPFDKTRKQISDYRSKNRTEEKQVLTHRLNTLRVLEGMIYIQTDKLDQAAQMAGEVQAAGLALGQKAVTRDALFGLSFPELIKGWRGAETLARKPAAGVARPAVRGLLAAASCIDTLLDPVRGAPRGFALSPSLVLWQAGAPTGSPHARDVLLGSTACTDKTITQYVAAGHPVAKDATRGTGALYLATSAAIYRSSVAVEVARGYCNRLSRPASVNCGALYVKPHLQAAAASMAAFLTEQEKASRYCQMRGGDLQSTHRYRFVLWYAWLRFNIDNFGGRVTC